MVQTDTSVSWSFPFPGQPDGIEDYHFSRVYVETSSLTTSVAGSSGAVVSSNLRMATTAKSTSKPASSTTSSKGASSTMTTAIATSSAGSDSGTVTKWGQCGGQKYNGATSCVSGTTCIMLNAWSTSACEDADYYVRGKSNLLCKQPMKDS
jgi:hypothetical protein